MQFSHAVCAALLCFPASQVVHPVLAAAAAEERTVPGRQAVHCAAPWVKVV